MSKSRLGRIALARRLAPLALVLGACAPAPPPTPGLPAPAQLSDANISSVAQTYNAGEVQAAQLAVTRSTPPIVSLAATMAPSFGAHFWTRSARCPQRKRPKRL